MRRKRKLKLYAACCLCEDCAAYAGAFGDYVLQWVMSAEDSGLGHDVVVEDCRTRGYR